MNPETEQLRIKVAELAGWNIRASTTQGAYYMYIHEKCECHRSFWWNGKGDPSLADKIDYLPELTLEWMHELWCKLTIDQHQVFRFELQKIVALDGHINGPCRSVCNATAEQRARAYIATMEQTNPKKHQNET